MFKFGENHPVCFEIILIVAAFLAAAAVTVAGKLFYMTPELSSSIGRLAVGAALFLIYRRAFQGGKPFTNLVIVIPALLFAAWNLFYNLSSGMEFGGAVYFAEALITAMAPAVFEEILFRGIFIYNLKKKGTGSLPCLFIPAIVFAAVHLTNLAGQDLASVALQVAYSFVIGLALGAVYLKNNSILQVIMVHFLIDFTNRIYVGQASSVSLLQLILFVVLLAAEAVYAVRLIGTKETAERQIPSCGDDN